MFIRRCKPHPDQFQMVALYYPYGNNDADGNPIPTQAVSFGDYLHIQTRNAIVQHGRVPTGLLQGVGMNGPPCDQDGIPAYQFRIPRDALWHGCNEQLKQAMEYPDHDLPVDLYQIKRFAKRYIV